MSSFAPKPPSVEPFPARVTVMTYNVWGDKHWPERSATLQQVIAATRADIMVLQEVTPPILDAIGSVLVSHCRLQASDVHSTSSSSYVDEDWEKCGLSIMWNDGLYKLEKMGFSNYKNETYPERGLLWARLSVRADPRIKFMVSTVHMPWGGCESELTSGINQRIPTTLAICQSLKDALEPKEALILAGDFNDDFHPLRLLNEEMGFIDVFESLDLVPMHTHPVRPSDYQEEMRPNRTLDWIMTVLPTSCKVVSAMVKTFRGGWPAASDHMPVIAVIELGAPAV